MPKRTNAFQELVAVIHSNLGNGWIVTESMFLQDEITGEKREVDVVAKATVANYDLFISIECRDHQRRADVTWVEGMAKKHESLPTSKLALWSKSGFTKAAMVKAAALKINTVSQANAATTDWATLARDLIGGHIQLATANFLPFIDLQPLGGKVVRLENVTETVIFDAQGNAVQSIPSILAFLQTDPGVRTTFLDHAPIGSGDFYLEMQPPVPWFIDAPDGNRVRIQRIGIGVTTFVEKLVLDTASATLDGGGVATLASANAASGRFQFYVEELPDGSQPIKVATIRNK